MVVALEPLVLKLSSTANLRAWELATLSRYGEVVQAADESPAAVHISVYHRSVPALVGEVILGLHARRHTPFPVFEVPVEYRAARASVPVFVAKVFKCGSGAGNRATLDIKGFLKYLDAFQTV